MEVIKVDQEVKEISRKVLWQGDVKKLTVDEYWDSHGHLSYWDKSTTYNQVSVRLERVRNEYRFFEGDPEVFDHDELYINNERYRCLDVDGLRGTTDSALARVIIGQG